MFYISVFIVYIVKTLSFQEAFDKPSQGETTKYPDAKFFYWYAHPEFVGDDVFESFTNRSKSYSYAGRP